MATDCIPQVTFEGEGFPKPVVARFDLPDASSDGGLVLLKAVDGQLGLTTRLAAGLDDGRQAGKALRTPASSRCWRGGELTPATMRQVPAAEAPARW